jgi:hypothetical protein
MATNVISIDAQALSVWGRTLNVSSEGETTSALCIALESGFPTAILAQAIVAETDTATLRRRFHEQADKWACETAHLSSPTQMMMHPSYVAILGMARENEDEIIRLMLHDLQDKRRLWFWALSYLTKENPIKQTDAGKLDKMIQAWVVWGKQRGKF